jgi:hypothetical protein
MVGCVGVKQHRGSTNSREVLEFVRCPKVMGKNKTILKIWLIK